MAKAAVSPLAPKKGRRPDFTGVPGEIVSLDGLGDLHWGNKLRGSPYDALLYQLAAAGQGKALKFGDERARASITVRARKKGYKVSFAVQGGALYVRFDGRVDDDVKARRREQILGALKFGPSAAPKLASILRGKGDEIVDGQMVVAILVQMQRDGHVIRQEGDNWALNTARRGK